MNQEVSLQISQQLEQESKLLIEKAHLVQIQTKDDVLLASQDLFIIQATLIAIEAIISSFKKLSEPLEKAKAILSGKITDWHVAEQKRVAEENERLRKEEEKRRKIQEAHAAQGHQVANPIEMKREAPVENKIGSTYMRTDWVWELINSAEIPREYLMIDTVKINTAVRAGIRAIPGIRIFEKPRAVTT